MSLETEADVESELLQNEKTKEIDINTTINVRFMLIVYMTRRASNRERFLVILRSESTMQNHVKLTCCSH